MCGSQRRAPGTGGRRVKGCRGLVRGGCRRTTALRRLVLASPAFLLEPPTLDPRFPPPPLLLTFSFPCPQSCLPSNPRSVLIPLLLEISASALFSFSLSLQNPSLSLFFRLLVSLFGLPTCPPPSGSLFLSPAVSQSASQSPCPSVSFQSLPLRLSLSFSFQFLFFPPSFLLQS